MTSLGWEPAEGYIAIELLDTDAPGRMPHSSDEHDSLRALCVGAAGDVTVCKRGDEIRVRPYARNGVRMGESIVLVEAYCVVT